MNFNDQLPAIVYQGLNDEQWTMTYLSKHCWQITGYERDDLINNNCLSYGSIIHIIDRDIVQQEIKAAVASHTEFDLEYRLYHSSGIIKWVWERGKGIYSSTGELLYLQGLIVDITNKRKIEQEKSLLLSITKAITSAINFETAVLYTLQKICTVTDWDFAEAWLPENKGDYFSYCTAWFPRNKDKSSSYPMSLTEFKQESFNFQFHYGEGLPGKVWAKKDTIWCCNLPKQKFFLRNHLTKLSGLKTAFGIPILAGEEVIAILVFFSRQLLNKSQDIVNLLQTVAYQLGHVFRYKQIETQLRNNKKELDTIVDSSLGVFFRINCEDNSTTDYISQGCQSLTGYSKEELLEEGKMNLAKITHPLDLQRVSDTITNSINKHTTYILEYRIFTKDNQEKWLWEKGKGIFDPHGNLLAIEGIITDISEQQATLLGRKKMEAILSQAENRYHNFFENAADGIFQISADGYYLSVNKALAIIYGYKTPVELIKNLNDTNNNLSVQPQKRQEFMQLLKSEEAITDFESQIYCQDGSIIWISENARAVRNSHNKLLYYEGTVEDITHYKKAQEKLHRQAFYDSLTQLPNRHLFLEYLGISLNKSKSNESSDYQFSVLFLDCDRFKAVNDSLGHSIGDLLLVAIGERLQNCINEKDILSRLGGDEFTILCDPIEDIKYVIQLAEKINLAFKPPFLINEHQLFCSLSIGIFFSSSIEYEQYKELTEAQIVQYAGTALYKAKSQKSSYYQVFQGDMHNEALANLQLENDIRKALKEKEFTLYYQPIINIATNKVKGFESLIRWNHPEKGLTTPHSFIDLAEQTGLIVPIAYLVLKEACQQLRQWHNEITEHYPHFSELPILNINLSSQEFSIDDFLEKLDQIIEETEVETEYIRLEITESASIFQENFTPEVLHKIVDRKIQLWIDDFGTGYSNLSYLHKLPIHGLKLDRYFIQDIESNTNKAKMVKAILSLAKDLDLEVVIEGIETKRQLKIIQKIEGKFCQGYFFSHPLPYSQVLDFLKKHN